ncbi:MAG: hypothetical protein LUH47_02975 [Clostridiales bacterium]|nr:hypothetical protein [Clostridiales bacterium]
MVKKAIKMIVGPKRVTAAKQSIKYVRDICYLCSNPRIKVDDNNLKYKKLSQKDKHIFFGYYDISQFDADEKRLLVHSVNKGANAHRDKTELGYYNLEDNKYIPFASTNAWCWQQGSRLRWHPLNEDIVLFNDVDNGKYITRLYNIAENKEITTLCDALYDVDNNFTYGLSLNFSRLQRLRPGYGYSVLPDKSADKAAPDDDGIFYIDIKDNRKKLLISLSELAAEVSDEQADQHYINHISISPDGKRFMFFHIWTLKGDTHWRTRLCVYDFNNKKREILEKADRFSHYDWKNNNELLVTCWDKNRKQYYCIYDIEKKQKNNFEKRKSYP